MISKAYLPKPITRNAFRKWAGKSYYRFKRYLQWQTKRKSFATTKTSTPLPFVLKTHQSLLLRPLMGVDMKLQEQKTTNIRLAIQPMKNLLIKPNETFSFWYLVKKPTKKRGFLNGLVLESGKIGVGVGGGLCQLANLLHWLVLHSPLEVTERWRHSYDVFPDANRKIPFGSGATVAYNYIDLQFRNPTSFTFQLDIQLTDTHLVGKLVCDTDLPHEYQIQEKAHFFRQENWGGYSRHNQLERSIIDKHTKITLENKIILENHALLMYEPFLE